jgi:hypothetical protein
MRAEMVAEEKQAISDSSCHRDSVCQSIVAPASPASVRRVRLTSESPTLANLGQRMPN